MRAVVLLLAVLVLFPAVTFAQPERITVVGPYGVQGQGQYNPDTGRYYITDSYTGRTESGQVRNNPYGGVTVYGQETNPGIPGAVPPWQQLPNAMAPPYQLGD